MQLPQSENLPNTTSQLLLDCKNLLSQLTTYQNPVSAKEERFNAAWQDLNRIIDSLLTVKELDREAAIIAITQHIKQEKIKYPFKILEILFVWATNQDMTLLLDYLVSRFEDFDCFQDGTAFLEGLKYYPQCTTMLIEKMQNPLNFKRIMTNAFVIQRVLAVVPEQSSEIFTCLLSDKILFKQVLRPYSSDLLELAKTNPTSILPVLNAILSDPDLLHYLITSFDKLLELAVAVPDFAPVLVNYLFKATSKELQQIHYNLDAFFKTTKQLQQYAPELINRLFEDPSCWQHLILNANMLCKIVMTWPERFHNIIERFMQSSELKRLQVDIRYFILIAQVLPDHAHSLFRLLMSDHKKYACLIKNTCDFNMLAEQFPEAVPQLMHVLLAQDGEFRRVIQSGGEFLKLCNLFPAYKTVLIDHLIDNHKCLSSFMNIHEGCADILNMAKQFPEHILQFIACIFKGNTFAPLTDEAKNFCLNIFKKLQKLYQGTQLQVSVKNDNSMDFLLKNFEKIINFYEVFGANSLVFMQSKLVSSPVPIERFFNAYQCIEKSKIAFFSALINGIHSKLSCNEIEKMSDLFGLVSLFATSIFDELHAHIKCNHINKAQELMGFLYEYCLMVCLKKMDILESEIDWNTVRTKLPLSRLILLMKGIQSPMFEMNNLVKETLKADFCKGRSFNTLVHSLCEKKNTTYGLKLAGHNAAGWQILIKGGINAELAYNYKYKKTITNGDTIVITGEEILQVIASLEKNQLIDKYGNKLREMLDKFQLHLLRGLTGSMALPTHEMIARILQSSHLNLIEKIAIKLKNLNYDIQKIQLNNEGLEAAQKLVLAEKNIEDCLIKLRLYEGKSIKNSKIFRVESYDKSTIETLFLGNDVSCCLAAGAEQFNEIFNRRFDDNCFMHVVRDSKGRPICINWLFFVSNAMNDKEIYVLANFFEIKSRYSRNAKLCNFLIESLSDFTKKFADEVGAKDFIIRPLTYGNIPDFKSFDTVEMAINKVGGYFDIESESTKSECSYFFESIHLDTFYKASFLNNKQETIFLDNVPENNLKKLSMFTKKNDNTSGQSPVSAQHITASTRKPS